MTVSSSNRAFFSGGFNPEVRESVAEEDLIRSFGAETFPAPPVEF